MDMAAMVAPVPQSRGSRTAAPVVQRTDRMIPRKVFEGPKRGLPSGRFRPQSSGRPKRPWSSFVARIGVPLAIPRSAKELQAQHPVSHAGHRVRACLDDKVLQSNWFSKSPLCEIVGAGLGRPTIHSDCSSCLSWRQLHAQPPACDWNRAGAILYARRRHEPGWLSLAMHPLERPDPTRNHLLPRWRSPGEASWRARR